MEIHSPAASLIMFGLSSNMHISPIHAQLLIENFRDTNTGLPIHYNYIGIQVNNKLHAAYGAFLRDRNCD